MSNLSSDPIVSLPSSQRSARSPPATNNTESTFNVPATPQSRAPRRRLPPPMTPQSANFSQHYNQRQRAANNSAMDTGADTDASNDAAPVDVINQVLWGTTVDLVKVKQSFSEFIASFRLENDTNSEPFYLRQLHDCVASQSFRFDFSCAHLLSFSSELHSHLIAYPSDILPAFDTVLNERYPETVRALRQRDSELNLGDDLQTVSFQTFPYNLTPRYVRGMRSLDPADIDTLVGIKGLVIRCSSLMPEMKRAHFQCTVCHHETDSEIVNGEIIEPTQCLYADCRTRHSYRLIHNRCLFGDKQIIKLQETPDTIPEGETPHSVLIHVFDDLVDQCQPGDRIQVTGIFRAAAVRANTRQSSLQTVYRTHLDGLHVSINDNSHFNNSAQLDSAISSEAIELQIRMLAADPNIYDRLVASLAPSIWEMDDVKRGLLCLLFGGRGADEGAGHGKFRGEINILMCGDPGTSKSQLLQYVNKLAPRGIYTSGKGSSSVGLTASISKDPETREMVLESGALVLSDRGVCCIDEFDKMSDSTRSILHEVMEQQTVSIAKAGIVCTLNARTSILASANPKESRYNPRLSVVENIQIMPTLLSRFDLIYLILDQPNPSKDRKLAKHLVSLYFKQGDLDAASANTGRGTSSPLAPIPQTLLTQYIAYARKHVRPTISDDARALLIRGYLDMRKLGQYGTNKVVTATPRQLEALIRLSEALARMRLQMEVQVEHVNEARRLMSVALASSATDPATGKIDMDLLMTGHSTNDRKRELFIRDAILVAIDTISQHIASGAPIKISKVMESANANSEEFINEEQTRKAITDLVHEGLIGYAGRTQDAVRKTS